MEKSFFRLASARAAKRRTVSASKPRGSWVRDGSSLPRKYPGCEVICFARSYLHQGGKPVFSTPLPSRGNRQFLAAGFPADCLRGCRVPVAHNQGTDRSGSVEHSAIPENNPIGGFVMAEI